MTARKSKNESEQDEKTAGSDESKTVQTTDEAAEQPSEKVEERGETDAKGAASGNVLGGVRDGDTGFVGEDDDVDFDLVEGAEDGEIEGALGSVVERSLDGEEYDAPYALVTADYLPRTSDSDDASKDWTAQHAGGEREDEDGKALDPVALTEVQGTPGQTFRVRELPNREVAEAAGIDYDTWVSGLPVRADVPDEAPRRGIPA